MWWNAGLLLKHRMSQAAGKEASKAARRHEINGGASKLDQERQAFLKTLVEKYGTLTKAWRLGLDADSNGVLDFNEFVTAVKFLGFTGNLRTMFFNLDEDDSGFISLRELDPKAAQALEKFRVKSTKKFGNMRAMWDELLDLDRSGTVGFQEFVAHTGPLGYHDGEELRDLFHLLLLRPGVNFIMYEDIHFLQCWEDSKQAQTYRKRHRTSWVNKDPYLREAPTLPGMNDHPHDWANMVALDEDHEKTQFKEFLVERFGSLPKAFDVMDTNQNGSLSLVEFQAIVSTVLRYCRSADARRLFLSFNQDPGAKLTWKELGITSEQWQVYIVARNREQKLREARLKKTLYLQPMDQSPRMQDAHRRHSWRLQDAMQLQPKTDVAFWGPLPTGWGFPHNNFDPKPPPKRPWSLTVSSSSSTMMTPSVSRSTLATSRQ